MYSDYCRGYFLKFRQEINEIVKIIRNKENFCAEPIYNHSRDFSIKHCSHQSVRVPVRSYACMTAVGPGERYF